MYNSISFSSTLRTDRKRRFRARRIRRKMAVIATHNSICLTDMSAYYVSIDAPKYVPHSVLLLSLDIYVCTRYSDISKRTRVYMCIRDALSRMSRRLGVLLFILWIYMYINRYIYIIFI